jgi:hypothetical protein
VHDEWCLIAELDGDEAVIDGLAESVAAELGSDFRLTRDRRTIRIYSYSETLAARAEEVTIGLIEKTPLGYELWQERWDEERGEWEELAPELPGEADGEEVASEDEEADARDGQ